MAVCGSSSRISICSGVFSDPTRSRTQSRTCPVSISSTPGRNVIAATMRSPHSSSAQSDDARGRHRVVGEQRVLDLRGTDVLAAADDRVVGAALAEQVAVDVEPAAVAGVEPAVGVGLRLDVGVRTAHLVAPDLDLAGRVDAEVGAGVVDDRAPRSPAPAGPTDDSRAVQTGSSLYIARRWSSGPSSATVLLVSVRPYAFTKSVSGKSSQRELEHRARASGLRRTRGCAGSGCARRGRPP